MVGVPGGPIQGFLTSYSLTTKEKADAKIKRKQNVILWICNANQSKTKS